MDTKHIGAMADSLVPPHDKNVIKEVEKIASVDDVKWSGGEKNITIIGKEMDEEYIKMLKTLSVYPGSDRKADRI